MQQDRINEIRALVHQMLKDRGRPIRVGDDESLFTSGYLDSMVAVDLIMRLETDFGIDFSRLDFDVVLIDSINAINQLTLHGQTV